MRIADFTFGLTGRAREGDPKIPGGMPHRIQVLAGMAIIPLAACLFSGCPTGPGSTTNTTPPTPTWSISDHTNPVPLTGIAPAGSLVTAFIKPGDDYSVTFTATSSSGIKSITLSGSGEVICHNNQPPFNEASPFKYTIPAQTITLSPQPGGQVFTQAFNPFFFFWALNNAAPATSSPAMTAFTTCGDQVPLLGSTTYTGQATTFAGASNPASSLRVTTCPSGLVSSPSLSCP